MTTVEAVLAGWTLLILLVAGITLLVTSRSHANENDRDTEN